MATINTQPGTIEKLKKIKYEVGAKNLNETVKALLGLPYAKDTERSFNSHMIQVDTDVHQMIRDKANQNFKTIYGVIEEMIAEYQAKA